MIRNYLALDRIVFATLALGSFTSTIFSNSPTREAAFTESIIPENTQISYSHTENFNPHGQKFCIFKSLKNAKYPMLQTYDPLANVLLTLLCGSFNTRNTKPKAAKKSEDLERMTVLREIEQNEDVASKRDKKYPGYRESIIGSKIEDALTIVGLLNDQPYPGHPIYDQMKEGMCIWWITEIENFKTTKKYLETIITQEGKPQSKSYLLLDLIDGSVENSLDNEDIAFLNEHFNLIKPSSECPVYEFYKNSSKAIGKIVSSERKHRYILESWTEMFLRQFESEYNYFKYKEATSSYTKDLVKIAIGSFIGANINEPLKNFCNKRIIGEAKKKA